MCTQGLYRKNDRSTRVSGQEEAIRTVLRAWLRSISRYSTIPAETARKLVEAGRLWAPPRYVGCRWLYDRRNSSRGHLAGQRSFHPRLAEDLREAQEYRGNAARRSIDRKPIYRGRLRLSRVV